MATFCALDLYKHFDAGLLTRFYNELIIPMFPLEDEREPLSEWMSYFEQQRNGESDLHFHIVLLLCVANRDGENAGRIVSSDNYDVDLETACIAGGCVFEFYSEKMTSLISYIVVNPEYSGRGLAKFMIKYAVDGFYADAQLCRRQQSQCCTSSCATCDVSQMYIPTFFETNKPGVTDGVMKSEERHKVLHSLGCRWIDVSYVQPALSKDSAPCSDLLLLTLKSDRQEINDDGQAVIASSHVLNFISSLWQCICGSQYQSDPVFLAMKEKLTQVSSLPLQDLPWGV
eukprot:GILJ01002506.1.p1 GENE.GILJ01002506.1~~GILJ01002506.1.p1  ORF type:complete len:286 (-),score=36.76 GILJ01002506.1:152-1009(-)